MKSKIIILILIFYIIFFNSYLSFAQNIEIDQSNENSAEESDDLGLLSEGAVLMEMNTGEVLYEKNMNERLYPASITKILTAILVLENCPDLNTKTRASKRAIESVTSGYTTADIKVGESFTIEELLEVMMLRSANEAANILAEYVSGSIEDFSILMNEKAKEIGAKDSNFLNANGMHNENHYSTAHDMAIIEKYCMQNEEYRRISSLTSCSLPNTSYYDGEPRVFKNTHAFLIKDSPYYYEYAISGKTGFTTPAKNCLVTCANKDDLELISVVLHAEGSVDGVSARYSDTKKLLDYGYDKFKASDFILQESNVKNEKDIEDKSSKASKVILKTENKKSSKTQSGDDVQNKSEILAIAILFGLAFVAIVVTIIFIIVTIKERREKYNFI